MEVVGIPVHGAANSRRMFAKIKMLVVIVNSEGNELTSQRRPRCINAGVVTKVSSQWCADAGFNNGFSVTHFSFSSPKR